MHGDSVGIMKAIRWWSTTMAMKVGPVSVVDQAGSPYSEALHVVERYRLITYEEAKEARERNVRLNGLPERNRRHRSIRITKQGPAGPIHGRRPNVSTGPGPEWPPIAGPTKSG